jgi:hypothetical protein
MPDRGRAFFLVRVDQGLSPVIVTIVIALMFHVIHGTMIAFLEALSEYATIAFVDRRMLVYLVIVGVGMTVVHIIAAGSFYAFTEPLTLRILIAVWRAIPGAIPILILILVLRWWGLCDSFDCRRCGHAEGESRN